MAASGYTTAQNSRSPLPSRFNRLGCGYATSSRDVRSRTAKLNAVIVLIMRSFGVGRRLPVSHRRPKPYWPGNTAITTSASPWPSMASPRPRNSRHSRLRLRFRQAPSSRIRFLLRPRPWPRRQSRVL